MAIFDEATEQRLLANDPTLTSLMLRLSDVAHLPNYSLRVGQALGRSTHLTYLDLDVNLFQGISHTQLFQNDNNTADLDGTAFQQAMNYLANKPALESLRLGLSVIDEHASQLSLTAAAASLFRAVNERTARGLDAVISLSLHTLILEVESMVVLFQNVGLQEFSLDGCVLESSVFGSEESSVHSIREVARSFASCATITQLRLGAFNLNVALICALLEVDDLKGKIDTLVLWNRGDENDGELVTTALSRFLRSSRVPLTMLSLHGFFWTGQSFSSISETVSTAQTRLNLGGGSMDSEACAMLRSMYAPNGEAETLSLSLDMQFPDTNEYQTLVELVGSTPGLTNLALEIKDSNIAINRQQFVAITRSLKSTSCAIQTLSLSGSLTDPLYEVLVNALPQFCSVKTLNMELPPDHWNDELMEGFRKNRSLKEVSIEGLDASGRTRLNEYLQRNKQLPSIIQLEARAFSSQSSTPSESGGAAVGRDKDVTGSTETTTAGKLLPPLFQASMDSAVPVGVSNVIGGLLCADENLGQRLASKRTHSNSV